MPRSPRLWPGTGPQTVELELPSRLRLWLSAEGYPIAQRLEGDEVVLLASTSDSPDSADVPARTRSTAGPTEQLLVQVPAGYGLLIDGGTPARTLVPGAALDAARSTAAPDGTEPELRVTPVPAEHEAVARAAVRAGRAAGVKRVVAAWASGGGRSGMWVTLHRPSEAALDAVHQAIAAGGLAAPARVVDIASLPGTAQSAVFRSLAPSGGGDAPLRLLTGRQELVVLAATVLGSLLLVLGRDADAVGTQAAGVALMVLVLVGCLAARQRSARRLDPLSLAGGAVLAGLLVWQAVRGLS